MNITSDLISKLTRCLIPLVIVVTAFSCTSETDRYKENVTRLRQEVRGSFSPKFDPIWIAREKKAAKARKELTRLLAVMDNALTQMEKYDPPPQMHEVHAIHRDLFRDCKQALLAIRTEANQKSPKGMKAVKIYQEMTRKILEVDEKS